MHEKLFVLFVALTLSAVALAQPPDPIRAAREAAAAGSAAPAGVALNAPTATPAATTTCTYQFTSAATATRPYLQYCVTVNGNVVEFQSPAGVEHIAVGTIGDGYALCDWAANGVGYHDYAGHGDADTGPGWGAPTLLSQTATVVKIARSTADGLWTLTQTFALNAADSSLNVTMAVKNNTAISRFIWFTRFTDIDAHSNTTNILDGTTNTVFGYDVSATGYGLQISLAAQNPFFKEGLATTSAANACAIGSGWTGLLNGADGAGYYWHGITVPPHGTKTVALKYKGI